MGMCLELKEGEYDKTHVIVYDFQWFLVALK